jgi:hypothetical protein
LVLTCQISLAFDRVFLLLLATADDEVDLAVGLLKRAIVLAPFGRWRWSSFLPIVVVVIVVILATLIIASAISSVIALVVMAIITTITPVVATPVVAVIATVVVTPVIAAVVVAIITSIPVIVARIGSAITAVASIRSTITVVETLATVSVIVVVAPGPLGGRRDSMGALQLLALPHGVLSITVKLAQSSMTMLKSPSRKVEGLGGFAT